MINGASLDLSYSLISKQLQSSVCYCMQNKPQGGHQETETISLCPSFINTPIPWYSKWGNLASMFMHLCFGSPAFRQGQNFLCHILLKHSFAFVQTWIPWNNKTDRKRKKICIWIKHSSRQVINFQQHIHVSISIKTINIFHVMMKAFLQIQHEQNVLHPQGIIHRCQKPTINNTTRSFLRFSLIYV